MDVDLKTPRLLALAGVPSEFRPETSCGPEIRYVPRPILVYEDCDERLVRVAFERWDALRVARREYLPYLFEPADSPPADAWPHVFIVDESPWLAERYPPKWGLKIGAPEWTANAESQASRRQPAPARETAARP